MPTPLVAAALALDRLSPHYQVQLSPADAKTFLALAPAYNDFTAAQLIGLVHQINRAIPPMQLPEWNANNGQPHHKYRVGNEGSRVLYVDITKSYLKDRWTQKDFDRLTQTLIALAVGANADEHTLERDDDASWPYAAWVFRIWWD